MVKKTFLQAEHDDLHCKKKAPPPINYPTRNCIYHISQSNVYLLYIKQKLSKKSFFLGGTSKYSKMEQFLAKLCPLAWYIQERNKYLHFSHRQMSGRVTETPVPGSTSSSVDVPDSSPGPP
jgi:hypothetical protein